MTTPLSRHLQNTIAHTEREAIGSPLALVANPLSRRSRGKNYLLEGITGTTTQIPKPERRRPQPPPISRKRRFFWMAAAAGFSTSQSKQSGTLSRGSASVS